jgi:transposase-like protein
MINFLNIKIGDFVEGYKSYGRPTAGIVTDKKKNMLMLENNRIVYEVYTHVSQQTVRVEAARVLYKNGRFCGRKLFKKPTEKAAIVCFRCFSQNVVRNGTANKRPRYKCKSCTPPKRQKYTPYQKYQAMALVSDGLSMWRAAKEMGVGYESLRKWVREAK